MAAPIVIAVGLDTTDAQRTAKQLAEAIRSALNGIDDQSQRIGRKFQSNMTSPLDSVLKQYRSFASSLGGVVAGLGFAGTLTGIGKAAVDAAIQIDRSRQTIAALTGSVAAANAKLAELRQLASSSPGVTTTFAADLFAQFKAIGTITDSTINTVIKSIGRLNAAFTLPDPQQFARNLQQIFSQGFERSDIKEALGQVPIFEQLLEQAFGTRDANKLRALKESGKLTAETYFQGLSEAILNDARFASIQESLGTQLQKATQAALVALAPIGDAILQNLLPIINKLGQTLGENTNELKALTNEVFGFLNAFQPLAALLKDLGTSFSFKDLLNEATEFVAGLKDVIELAVAAIAIVVRSTVAGLAQTFSGLLNRLGISVDDFVASNIASIRELTLRLQQGNVNQQRVQAERAQREQQGQAPSAPGASTAQIPSRLRATSAATDEALQKAKQFRDAQLALERERVEQVNRVLKAEGDARLQEFERQYENGLVTFRQLSDAKIAIQQESTNRQLELLKLETTQLEAARSTARGAEKLTIEAKLLRLYADQKIAVLELTTALEDNFAEYRRRNALPQLDLNRAPQEQVQEQVDPLILAARERIAQAREVQISREIALTDISRQRIEIENQLERGILTQADAREQINALLRQERDLRIAMLEAEKAMGDVSDVRAAKIDEEIASLRNLGVELTAAQRFMRGFNSEVESTGDAFERLGQNLSRSFANVKGLLDNLKQSFVTFFRDLLGIGLQRVFSQLFGGLLGGLSGAGRAAGGVLGGGGGGGIGTAVTGSLGAIFGGGGGGGGFLTPGFGGGFPIVGGAFGGAASPIGIAGGLPIVNTAGIGAAGAAGIFGRSATAGAFAGLSGLFRGFGFGQAAGSARGPLAALAPLLGAQVGAGLGGRSGLGQLLGGIGGAALGIGLTAAPSFLGTGLLAGLFSNPITAVVGGALLVGSILLGRSKQRRTDEEQAGIWLTDAVNGISQLRDQARAGQITLEQARQVFETQILTTFVSQIQTLKTKSVRESRLTNQVRDLRNLFESTVVSAAKTGARVNDINSKLVPEFATGGIVPGIDRGFDSVLAKVRPGEMVLTRNQQSAIQSMAGGSIFRAAGVPDRPGISGGLPAFANGGVMPQLWRNPSQSVQLDVQMNLVVGRDDASALVVSGQTTRAGQRATVAVVRKAVLEREF